MKAETASRVCPLLIFVWILGKLFKVKVAEGRVLSSSYIPTGRVLRGFFSLGSRGEYGYILADQEGKSRHIL